MAARAELAITTARAGSVVNLEEIARLPLAQSAHGRKGRLRSLDLILRG